MTLLQRISSSGTLWRNGGFLRFWVGETISQLGTQVTSLALPLTAIITLQASAVQLGVINALLSLPVLVISLFAGVWVDRGSPRRILIFANLGRALLLGGIPLLVAFQQLHITYLYISALGVGILSATFDIAYGTYLPRLIQRSDLVDANSKLQVSNATAQIAGPGLGGILVQLLTAPIAILADALSYVVAALSVISIRQSEPERPTPATRQGVVQQIREGFKFTFQHRYLRALVLNAAWFNLFEQIVVTLYVLYGTQELHLSPGLIGLTMTLGSSGSVVGTVLASALGRRIGSGQVLVVGLFLGCFAPTLIAFAGGSLPMVVAMLSMSFFLYGLGLTIFNIPAVSLRQAITPSDMLGRVMATYRFIAFGTIPIGALVGGILANTYGLRPTLIVAAVALLCGWTVFAINSPAKGITKLLSDTEQ